MLDRLFIRESLAGVEKRLKAKGFIFDRHEFQELDRRERSVRAKYEKLRALRNRTSAEIALLRKQELSATEKIKKMQQVSADIKQLDDQLTELEQRIHAFLSGIPNLPHESVPIGRDISANAVVRTVGHWQKPDFPVKDHVELGVELGILDLERASKIAGARFSNYYGQGALLERALINFMLDIHTRLHGYREVLPPFMANRRSFFGTGNLPKFASDLFHVDGTDYFLVPTAEVPVTNLLAQEVVAEEDLPISFVANTPCFRSEAGSYGKDTRGLIRQHQFNKVELVKFTKPEDSYHQLELLTVHAEEILCRLGLPYQVVTLCSGDMGFSATKTYDLEVWIPSQQRYREISSCSNFEDFQARRADIRYKPKNGKKARFVHTLNGSALAVGRTWVAIVENFQQADGSVTIPKALRPYMQEMEKIERNESGFF